MDAKRMLQPLVDANARARAADGGAAAAGGLGGGLGGAGGPLGGGAGHDAPPEDWMTC